MSNHQTIKEQLRDRNYGKAEELGEKTGIRASLPATINK
jgi:hypothetical protein